MEQFAPADRSSRRAGYFHFLFKPVKFEDVPAGNVLGGTVRGLGRRPGARAAH